MESPFCDTCPDDLRVIETIRYDPVQGLCRRDLHLDRLAETCGRLSIPFNRTQVLASLSDVAGSQRLRVRLSIGLVGDIDLGCQPLVKTSSPWRVAVADDRLDSNDPWLGVKTTQRRLYDESRALLPPDVDEFIFLNERGEVCEGTITNVFVGTTDGMVTPPISSGLLPGVLRHEMLRAGRLTAAVLTLNDLRNAGAFFVGNSLRGLIPAELV